VQLPACHLHANAGQEANKNTTRQKISEKAETQDSGEKEDPRGDQCDDTCEFDVESSIGRERERCKTSSDNRCRCRIRADDQVA
jgi:hypothetical protein